MGLTYMWIGGTGIKNWSDANNWSPPGPPESGDQVYILSGSSKIELGLAQASCVLESLVIGMGFTGTIGSAGDYLHIGATRWTIGVPAGGGVAATGSGRIKIDFGADPFDGLVVNTSNSSLESTLDPLRILGGSSSNTLYVRGGRVGVATTQPGEYSSIQNTYIRGGIVTFGCQDGNVEWDTVVNNGGSFVTYSGGSTLTNVKGTVSTNGQGKIVTMSTADDALISHRAGSGSSIGSLTVLSGGSADFTLDPRPLTIDNDVVLYEGASASLFSPGQVLKEGASHFSASLVQCGLADVKLSFGDDLALTIAPR
jgi:hypothetical protein